MAERKPVATVEPTTKPDWLVELESWQADGTLKRLSKLAGQAQGYHSGDREPQGVHLVEVERTAGGRSLGVVTGLGHAGRGTYVKLRYSKGAKYVHTSDLLKWNPWLRGEVSHG